MGKYNGPYSKGPYRLLALWILVSLLWTAATLIRLYKILPLPGPMGALSGQWVSISLIVPPMMFGVIIAAVYIMGKWTSKK
jgi:hypothetical protein